MEPGVSPSRAKDMPRRCPGICCIWNRRNRDEDVEAVLSRLKDDVNQEITVMGYSAPFRPGRYYSLTLRDGRLQPGWILTRPPRPCLNGAA